MSNVNFLRKQLYASINELIENYQAYLSDGKNYFSRDRKLPLKTLIESILFMGANAIKDELYDLFDFKNTPTTSAFVQQRKKLLHDAFKFLFDSFNEKTYSSKNKLFKGYRLFAIDGSSIPISHNPNDDETYIKKFNKYGEVCKGYNAFHLIASYDLLDHTYDDVVIQGEAHLNESSAFNILVLRNKYDKAIFIGDRGFEFICLCHENRQEIPSQSQGY